METDQEPNNGEKANSEAVKKKTLKDVVLERLKRLRDQPENDNPERDEVVNRWRRFQNGPEPKYWFNGVFSNEYTEAISNVDLYMELAARTSVAKIIGWTGRTKNPRYKQVEKPTLLLVGLAMGKEGLVEAAVRDNDDLCNPLSWNQSQYDKESATSHMNVLAMLGAARRLELAGFPHCDCTNVGSIFTKVMTKRLL